MKLRMANMAHHAQQQMYSSTVTALKGSRGIRPVADDGFMQVELWGCTRPLIGIVKSRLAEHCFLRIVDRSGDIVDSASFGQTGGDERDRREQGNYACTFIGNISAQKWQAIKTYFSGCGDYSVRKNNCCTCAVGALRQENLPVPGSFTSLNHGVGTTNECSLQ